MSKGKDVEKSEKPEKTRTLGKVQWERDRRNRLKDAFSILEKLVTSADGTDCEKDKLSNIETLQKAAILIEKLQSQVSNLSIRLKEPSEESVKEIRIYLSALSQKCRDLKIVLRKLVTSNRKQRVDAKEKPSTRIPVKRLRQRPKQKNKENLSKFKRPARPPALLPKQALKNGLKNGIPSAAENQTLFFLRPNLVLPSPQPTFLLLPPNTLTQPPLSISGPTAPTSTTTVNRLPIPAYSHALSANTKATNNINPTSNYTAPRRVSCHTRWRILRALRQNDKSNKGKKKKDAKPDTKLNESKPEADDINTNNKNIDMTVAANVNTEKAKDALVEVVSIIEKSVDISTTNAETVVTTSIEENQTEDNTPNNANISEIVKDLQNTDSEKKSDLTKETPAEAPPSKKIKIADDKELETAKPATKETKTPVEAVDDNNCEVVDAVNSDVAGAGSRLELAEELLAASPTAAFLLTFPLVSGTRPDTPEDNSRTQSDRNLAPAQNSDGLDGLASFFTGKEQFSNKTWMPEQPPKIEFPSKEISSCAMSNVYNSIKNPAPASITDSLHTMSKQRQVDSNHIYKQNDNISHDAEKNVNKCYNFGMQDGAKMPNNYFAKSQSKEQTPAPRQITQTKMACENNSYFHNSYLQNHGPTFGSQTKSSNVYPDYNIPNIYSQSVNMWNEEVTYHDLNTVQNAEGNSKQTPRYNYPTHYSNESRNFYKPFVPATSASSMKIDCNQKPKLKQSIPDAKCNDERIMTAKKPTIKGPVNWMTSEARSYASNMKFDHATYPLDPSANINNENALNARKADYQDTTQFYSLPTSNYNFQMNFEDCQQNWNAPKLAKADDLQLDPPSTLPTLIGDLALGTLERKRPMHTVVPPPIPIVSTQETFPPSTTFFSVSNLVENASSSVPTSRSQFSKSRPTKPESNIESFPYYNTVPIPQQPKNSISSCAQPRQYKNKPDVNANAKQCKTNYSAEALIRGVPHTNWMDSKPLQDPQFSQMPHFPPVLDLGETLPQQYTTNSFSYGTAPTTVAPSFYPSHSFMPSNYMGSGFLPDIMDFSNVSSDNNFSLPRFDPKKKENSQNKSAVDQKTLLFNPKQKADNFKKDSNKKQNQKRPKGHIEQSWLTGAEMNASAAITSPLLTDDTFLSYFPTSQVYQSTPTFPVSSHTTMEPFVGMPPSQQSSCSVTTTIATAKTNFNLSTIFPEINKQQNTSTTYCTNLPGSARQSHIKHPQEYQFRNVN